MGLQADREEKYKYDLPYLLPILRGVNKAVDSAGESVINSVSHPIRSWKELGSSISQLVGHPIDSGKAIIEQLRKTTKDPEAAAEFLTSMAIPGPGEVGKMAKIIAGPVGISRGVDRVGKGLGGQAIGEIDDQMAHVYPGAVESIKRYGPSDLNDGLTADQIFNHPELYKRYPELARASVEYSPDLRAGAAYMPDTNKILMGPYAMSDEEALRRHFLHELQHGTQKVEKYTEESRMMGSAPKSKSDRHYYEYLRDRGEVESRVVEQRRDWLPEQRAAIPLEKHLEYELDRATNRLPLEDNPIKQMINIRNYAKRDSTPYSRDSILSRANRFDETDAVIDSMNELLGSK